MPVYTDGGASKANALGEVESKWLWAAAEPQLWRTYFEELLSERGMAMVGAGARTGLNPDPNPNPNFHPNPHPNPNPGPDH